MISRFARLCAAGVFLASVQATLAQAPAPLPQNPPTTQPPAQQDPQQPMSGPVTPPPGLGPTGAVVPPAPPVDRNTVDNEPVTLQLPDADIDTVLDTLELYTGKVILRPSALPQPPGGYNLKITKEVPKWQAVLYIETILAMNGIAVIPMGEDALKIVQVPMARMEAPELILDSTLEMPPSSKIASKLFQLEFLRVQEFQQMLGTMINPTIAQAMPLVNANAVLITDTISNLQRIETLLREVDRPIASGMSTKFYQLQNGAKASDVVAKLGNILRPLQQQIGAGTSYSADDRSNQVILITDRRQFPLFDDLIEKLDVRADPNTRNEVIYLKHAKAEEVATVLVNIIRGQSEAQRQSQSVRPTQTAVQPTPTPPSPLGAPAAPPQPTVVAGTAATGDMAGANEFSGFATVVSDPRSNAIVVTGTVDDIRLLEGLIEKLDIVLAQVRIEVVIAEVTLDNNSESGISALGLQLNGDKLVGFNVNGTGFGIAGTTGTDGSIGGFATITRPDGSNAVSGPWDLAGIISLTSTPRKSNTTILTVPAVVTSHGKQAVINDGETRPVITGTTNYAAVAGATTTSQVTQQQIGTTLTVTPFIGNNNVVQLDIQQELTDVIGEVLVDNNVQYRIGTRKTTSYITAKSGEIIVLGGFRKDADVRSRSRLGPIPIIGDLFGPRKKQRYHQELIFFLRPMVLTNVPAIDNAETMMRMERLPTREQIKESLDPYYQPPKQSVLDKILPK